MARLPVACCAKRQPAGFQHGGKRYGGQHESPGSADRDGSVLDYSRLNSMTIQAWSPFQAPNWGGCFLGTSAIRI